MYFVRGVKKNYFMQEEHTIMKLVQAFDPSYMDEHDLTEDFVNELDTIRPIKVHKLLPEMINELGAYKQAAKNFHCDHETTETFTKEVMEFWAKNRDKFPTWSKAARIIFSLTPGLVTFTLQNVMFTLQKYIVFFVFFTYFFVFSGRYIRSRGRWNTCIYMYFHVSAPYLIASSLQVSQKRYQKIQNKYEEIQK